MSDVKISVDRCSRHGSVALMIGDDSSGYRLTSGKCCGSWNVVLHSWRVDAPALRKMATELVRWAEEMDATPHGAAVPKSPNGDCP